MKVRPKPRTIADIDREIAEAHDAFLRHYFAGETRQADDAHEAVDELLDERWKLQRQEATCAPST